MHGEPALIDQWRTQRLKNGLTTETVNRDIATFKAALSKAVLWGYIENYPLEIKGSHLPSLLVLIE